MSLPAVFHDRKEVPADFDPRKASKHVARTVAFERWVDVVPVFGSELLVGLNPDGSLGRFRMHWPKLDPALVKAAGRLASEVRARSGCCRRTSRIATRKFSTFRPGSGTRLSLILTSEALPWYESFIARPEGTTRIRYRQPGTGTSTPLARKSSSVSSAPFLEHRQLRKLVRGSSNDGTAFRPPLCLNEGAKSACQAMCEGVTSAKEAGRKAEATTVRGFISLLSYESERSADHFVLPGQSRSLPGLLPCASH